MLLNPAMYLVPPMQTHCGGAANVSLTRTAKGHVAGWTAGIINLSISDQTADWSKPEPGASSLSVASRIKLFVSVQPSGPTQAPMYCTDTEIERGLIGTYLGKDVAFPNPDPESQISTSSHQSLPPHDCSRLVSTN
ncbi:uncharacterized protein BP5553_02012 [Venustampulla echinocandica]|uniref:Uncharacterized protein n=1 Tax=Venustampulla echinocandica TaxID=2656787 RepID=A0A370U2U1_9HELO|nr:uncharacterized protein BP5553_02012 [Venustampulla echinocandica]RDL42033.1 hypothetical protein BP5553_02012 [Venustampulla echinocandica]